MNDHDQEDVPQLDEPEIRGDLAEAQGLLWAEDRQLLQPHDLNNRLLVPDEWVEDAVRGALAEFQDDIVDAVKAELRERMQDIKGQ